MLTKELAFPPPERATPEGLVAVGGDTSPERLILAYSQGIFPWPHEGLPLLWFSPDPRFVISFECTHIGRSLRKRIRAGDYEIRTDTAFERLIEQCAAVERPGQDGTWINDDIASGFIALHRLGLAHSVEAWRDGQLVGGLYGVALGRSFCGESMFAIARDASKVATVCLLGNLSHWGFHFVDCQVYTDHLARFGAREWPRRRFLEALRRALAEPTIKGAWRFELDPPASLARLDAVRRLPA
ncbi:MAG: leucyl/phenylalanyl-tRNA--protein transferase [Polyangiales bacterium]